jgi:hypothetical protein
LIILLSQASEFQERVDPTNAVGIFPQKLCRAQLPVTVVRVRFAETLDHQEGVCVPSGLRGWGFFVALACGKIPDGPRSHRRKTMATLLFVHGTGVRMSRQQDFLSAIKKGLPLSPTPLKIEGCLWGDPLGVKLKYCRSIPREELEAE